MNKALSGDLLVTLALWIDGRRVILTGTRQTIPTQRLTKPMERDSDLRKERKSPGLLDFDFFFKLYIFWARDFTVF